MHIDAQLNYDAQVEFAKQSTLLAMQYSTKAIATCKFNPDSSVFLHFISTTVPDIPIVWIDTGFNSAETLRFVKRTCSLLRINLHVYHPHAHSFRTPPDANTVEYEAFVNAVKVEPFERAMRDFKPDVWFSSLRRYQTDHRAERKVFERSSPAQLKVLPMLNWTREETEHYRSEHQLPEGPVVIDPTKLHERIECGMHVAI